MDLHMSNMGTLVPEDLAVCFMLQGVKFTVVWHLWFFTGTLIWYNTHINTNTHRYTAHAGANRLTHPYKYIVTQYSMCSQRLSVLHWVIHWYQKFTFHNVSSFQKLLTCKVMYLLIRCNITKLFLWNTNNTDRNGGVNRQNTHQTSRENNTEKDYLVPKYVIPPFLKQPFPSFFNSSLFTGKNLNPLFLQKFRKLNLLFIKGRFQLWGLFYDLSYPIYKQVHAVVHFSFIAGKIFLLSLPYKILNHHSTTIISMELFIHVSRYTYQQWPPAILNTQLLIRQQQ